MGKSTQHQIGRDPGSGSAVLTPAAKQTALQVLSLHIAELRMGRTYVSRAFSANHPRIGEINQEVERVEQALEEIANVPAEADHTSAGALQ